MFSQFWNSKKRTPDRRKPTARLDVEQLERRDVPSTVHSKVGGETPVGVNPNNTMVFGNQTERATSAFGGVERGVAMDSAGDYVVAWEGDYSGAYVSDGQFQPGPYQIYARVYNANGTPRTGFIKVNTDAGPDYYPSVAMDAEGDFVVAWQAYDSPGFYDIYARRFNSSGTALNTQQFQVSPSSEDGVIDHENATVAMDAAGDFVIAWANDTNISGGSYGIFAKLYTNIAADTPSGIVEGSQFEVDNPDNPYGNFVNYPSAAMDPAGDFVISFNDEDYINSFGASSYGIFAQLYNAQGQAQESTPFQVNTSVGGPNINRDNSSVAMDSAGGFVITWQSNVEDGSEYGIYARLYYPGGSPETGEIGSINTYTLGDQTLPNVAMDSQGDFVVSWDSYNQAPDSSGDGVFARSYSPSGTPLDSQEFPVNTYTTGNQKNPSIAMDPSGDFVIAWDSYGQDYPGGSYNPPGYGVYTQRYQNLNQAPSGANNTVTTLENIQYTFATANFGFSDPNTPPQSFQAVEITTIPATGSLKDNGGAVSAGQFVSATDINGGLLVYSPVTNGWSSPYSSFTFQVEDSGSTANGGANLDATLRTVTIDVTEVNHAPIGTNNTVTTLENTGYTFATANFGFSDPNDTPPNNFLAVDVTTLPGSGTLKDNGNAVSAGEFVPVSDVNGGMLVFSPAANGYGNPYTSFTFQVEDDGGTANGGVDTDATPRTMTINVTQTSTPVTLLSVVTNGDYAPVEGASLSAGTVTMVTDGPNGFTAGNQVVIAGYSSGNTGYNGTYTILTASGQTFTYADTNTGMTTLASNSSGYAISQSNSSNALQPGFQLTGTGHQRSMVDSVAYTFNEAVNSIASAVSMGIEGGVHTTGTAVLATAVPNANWTSLNGGTIWVMTFTSSAANTVSGHSLADGVYTLALNNALVTASVGGGSMAATRATDVFFRLYGDFNSSHSDNATDTGQYSLSLNLNYLSATAGYQAYYDYTGTGHINATDTGEYSLRLNSNWTAFTPTI